MMNRIRLTATAPHDGAPINPTVDVKVTALNPKTGAEVCLDGCVKRVAFDIGGDHRAMVMMLEVYPDAVDIELPIEKVQFRAVPPDAEEPVEVGELRNKLAAAIEDAKTLRRGVRVMLGSEKTEDGDNTPYAQHAVAVAAMKASIKDLQAFKETSEKEAAALRDELTATTERLTSALAAEGAAAKKLERVSSLPVSTEDTKVDAPGLGGPTDTKHSTSAKRPKS